jgi:hypothetical protein
MLVDSGTLGIGSSVTGAIRQASAATGTSFSYLLATAQVESGLDPRAGASTSSARGLFQFVEQTWLGTMKQSGAALGYGRFADAITRTPSGHFEVKDPAMRSAILKLRNDPTANAVMAGAFTQANAAYLTQKLGRPPTEGELYIAHFLGAGGAGKLISLASSNPNANAANLFPGAAQANRSIFYDRRTGAPRSLAEVRDALTGRYDVARTHPLAPAATVEAANVPPPIPLTPTSLTPTPAPTAAPLSIVPDTAGITSAYAAAAPAAVRASTPHYYPMFHGLFADSGAPAASAVSQLWTTPSAPPDTATAPVASAATPPATPAPFGSSLLDLFRDPVRGT